MKTVDIIKRAGRNLRQAKLRTALTALAISIGAFVIMTSLAFGIGINNYTDSLIGTNINDRTLSVSKETVESFMANSGMNAGLRKYSENYSKNMFIEMLDDSDITTVAKIDGVKKVIPFQLVTMKYFQLDDNEQKWSSFINMFDPFVINETLSGKILKRGDNIALDEIIIPESYLKDLDISEDEIIDKKITITFSVTPTQTSIQDLQIDLAQITPELIAKLEKGLEKTYEFRVAAVSKNLPLSVNTAQLLINEDKYSEISQVITKGTDNYGKYMQLLTLVEEGQTTEEVKRRIEEQTDLKAMTARELQQMVSQVTNILQIVVISFGALSLVVSVFGIVNTLYVSVLERTSQIGLMKALGMRGKHVAKLFRYEAAWVGFIGGVTGVGLSWLTGTLLNPWLSELIGFKPEDGIYLLQYNLIQAIVLITILIIIAVISSFMPARKAAKLDPIEALRYE